MADIATKVDYNRRLALITIQANRVAHQNLVYLRAQSEQHGLNGPTDTNESVHDVLKTTRADSTSNGRKRMLHTQMAWNKSVDTRSHTWLTLPSYVSSRLRRRMTPNCILCVARFGESRVPRPSATIFSHCQRSWNPIAEPPQCPAPPLHPIKPRALGLS